MNAILELQQTSILIVDDDVFVQSVIKAGLENIGYKKVRCEDNGGTALDLLAQDQSIELVILDLHMPEIDGIRFMRGLADSRPGIDVVLASGEDGRLISTAISLGRSMGVNVLGSLEKPVQLERLQDLLDQRRPAEVAREELHVVKEPLSREDLQDGLLGAGKNNRPHLMFQPIVSLMSKSIVTVEVLARWWNRDRGILSPHEFIPLAEQEELLDTLTRDVYNMTIKQIAQWHKSGLRISAAVNLSINSFRDENFARFLFETAARQNIDCSRLIFEVAESQTSEVTPQCLEALLNLRLRGFRLSIDDFGTGSSSFTHVKNIPFTELKIDREFVSGASLDQGSRSILEESINLARRLDMSVVAEGVENRGEWDLVEQLGCDFVQGYYCAKPLSNTELMKLLESWQGPHRAPRKNPALAQSSS